MKTRPVVIHVPVVRFPTWVQVRKFAWRFAVLFALVSAGFAVAEFFPAHKFTAGIVAGVWLRAFLEDSGITK